MRVGPFSKKVGGRGEGGGLEGTGGCMGGPRGRKEPHENPLCPHTFIPHPSLNTRCRGILTLAIKRNLRQYALDRDDRGFEDLGRRILKSGASQT
jgi:hypothetical protein